MSPPLYCYACATSEGDFRKIGVWLSPSDVVMSWLRREVHPTSISYVYKVFQHIAMLWMGT
jgi:hypothetical protein